MGIKQQLRKMKRTAKGLTRAGRIMDQTALIMPELACIDVGSSYYPHPAWEIFRRSPLTRWVAVEPNQGNLSYFDNWQYPCKPTVVATGLSESGGQQILYKTRVDSGSSLLKPVIHPAEAHRLDPDYFFPIEEIPVETITLSEVAEAHCKGLPIAIKLDTQGTELSILRGLGLERTKRDLVAVDIEVTLKANPIMQGSARFHEVQRFLEDAGLELVFLNPIESPIMENSRKLGGHGVLNECDAVFLLRRDVAEAKGDTQLLILLGLYNSYRLFDEAYCLIQRLLERTSIDPALKSRLNSLKKLLQGL